jgi:hypothetical protein
LPNLLPQPKGKQTLIGGTIAKVDHVRDEITVKVFGGGSMRVLFDGRTHIDRDGTTASESDLQIGQRVYLDTMQADANVFAQHIRVVAQEDIGQMTGQVMSYDSQTGELVLNDAISQRALKLRVTSTTTFSREGRAGSNGDLLPQALVSVAFVPNGSGPSVAREVSVLAAPGKIFVFAGRVVQLDLHVGSLVMVDPRDQKSYEIAFDANVVPVSDSLREGASVVARASFDGRRYVATAITVDSEAKP